MKTLLLSALLSTVASAQSPRVDDIWVEAEAFDDLGGWSIDTASTLQVGSPYLLAHGLGRPVADAQHAMTVKSAGEYRLYVRTRDWVAPWGVKGAPGRFRVVLDGTELDATFGTESAEWHWQAGPTVELTVGRHELLLRDLTGFDGRCDAILLTKASAPPPNDGVALDAFRRRALGLGPEPAVRSGYDLVVVGGGYAGMAAAISAARQSLRVALIQDRRVLGGNGSSEVRVWANGGTMRGKYPRLGEIVEEFGDHAPDSPGLGEHYGDEHKLAVCQREPNLELFLGHFVDGVTVDSTTRAVQAVSAWDVRAGQRVAFRGKLFADCTGHGTVGALAGADFEIHDGSRMGMSNMWYWQKADGPQAWPSSDASLEWVLPLTLGDFPDTRSSRSRSNGRPFFKGEWFWESGFEQDPIDGLERIRDWNLRAVFGAFTALKRSGKHPNARLDWVAHVGGTRESRLLRGDIVLSRADIVDGRQFPDGLVATTWDIDLHYPKQRYAKKFPGNPFISRAEFGAGVDRHNGYLVPYRCLYSRNVPNLFMAGRCISVTHEALGTVRVMRTCGMMGEVVGKAAYLAVVHEQSPRGVYEQHLDALVALCKQPGAMRRSTRQGPLVLDSSLPKVTSYFNKGRDAVEGVPQPKPAGPTVAVASLPGLVVDDRDAELVGNWREGNLRPAVGSGYRYAGPGTKATATFRFAIRSAGRYDVRVAWVGHENRGQRVGCTVERAGRRSLRLRLDQTEVSKDLFHSIGVVELPAGDAAVILSAEDAGGHVHADAVQIVPAK